MLPKTVMQSSIVGDRVAVEIGDGYYAPAIIKSMRTDSSSSETTSECIYTVCFDDGKSKYCTGDEIIGSSFKSITDIKLQPYQKVYTVYKGCEVSGYVLSCDSEKVKIQLPGFTEKEVVERTLNELYLFTNRWDQTSTSQSQYNVDNIGNPDNMTSEDRSPCKDGRAISASIKVPQSTGVRKTSEEPTMTELIAAMVLSNLSCSPVFHHPPMLNNPQTNLGTSPQSLDSSGVGSWSSRHISPTRHSNNPTVVVGTPGGGRVVDHHRLTPSDEPSDDDVNMILIDRSTPTPKGGSKSSQDEMQDEPQDLRVPRVNVVRPSSYKDSEPMEAKEVGTAASTSQHNTTAPIPFPVVLSNYPYYFPPNVVPHPLATSLPPDFRFQLSSLPPHPSVMTITRSPPPQQQQRQSVDGTGSVVVSVAGSVGHSDGKMSHRHHHRPTPYHKVAEEALLSAAGSAGSSPSSSKPVHPSTQHSQYYPFQSSPVPIASLSFSPTHHVKQHSRSHLVAASPTSRSTLSPSSSQQLSHSSNERTSPLAIPTAGGGYAVYESRCQPRITPVMGASGPINIATAKAFSWQNECSPAAFSPKPSIVHQRQQIHQLASPKMGFPMSPKPLQIGRKVRGDGKKCRKVYGMERRDLWCTSCRWKKACQRFPD